MPDDIRWYLAGGERVHCGECRASANRHAADWSWQREPEDTAAAEIAGEEGTDGS